MTSNMSPSALSPKHLASIIVALLLMAWVAVVNAQPAHAAITTYSRNLSCLSTGVSNFDVTATVYWYKDTATNKVDLWKIVTVQHQGVNQYDWSNSMTVAHRWSGTNKESATFNPIISNTTYFDGIYWNTPTASEIYMAASNNARGIKCGPKVDNAV